MMKKQVSLKLYILAVVGILVIVGLGIFIYTWKNQSMAKNINYDAIPLEYGDSIQKFQVSDSAGETLSSLPDSKKDYSVVFYLSATCHGCTDILGNFDRIQSIFGQEKLDYYYLWTDGIPDTMLKEYSIDEQLCYSMGTERLATSMPTFYIVDGDMNVEFTTIDASLLVEKLVKLDIFSKEELVDNANRYLGDCLLDDSVSDHLVYFAMEGCPDCEAVNPFIESDEITKIYDVLKIYKYDDLEEGRLKDNFGIFKEVYGISWYPSFLVFHDGDFEFIGEISIDELEKVLLEHD